MDSFGEFIIFRKEYLAESNHKKIDDLKQTNDQSRYFIYDIEDKAYYEDSVLTYIPKKGMFKKPKRYHVYFINEAEIYSKSAVFVPYKDSDFEKAIYEMRVPFDFSMQCKPTTLNEMTSFVKSFGLNGRSKISKNEFIGLFKHDLDFIIKKVISDYLTTQGRISVIKHLLDIEKTIISQAQQYANLCDKGIKVISVKIDPTISFEEAKIQERVTQSKAVKNIIDKGDQE